MFRHYFIGMIIALFLSSLISTSNAEGHREVYKNNDKEISSSLHN